jgi:hypothetical protein
VGGLVTGVEEPVGLAGRDYDGLPGPGDDLLHSEPETHRAADDLEGLLLLGMDVRAGDGAAGREHELDRQQLTVGVRGRLAEDDLLAADRILQNLSCTSHRGPPPRICH